MSSNHRVNWDRLQFQKLKGPMDSAPPLSRRGFCLGRTNSNKSGLMPDASARPARNERAGKLASLSDYLRADQSPYRNSIRYVRATMKQIAAEYHSAFSDIDVGYLASPARYITTARFSGRSNDCVASAQATPKARKPRRSPNRRSATSSAVAS